MSGHPTLGLPAPLVPPNVDLTDFSFMPLYIARLKQSKAWAYARRDPAIGFYLINLWTHAWHGDPAGSLEDDDMMLSDAAQCNIKIWTKVSSTVLRSWVKCSDGRYYHPVIAEIVLEVWQRKIAQRERTAAARRARQQKRAKLLNGSGSPDGGAVASVTTSVTDTVTDSATTSATTSVTTDVTGLSLHPRDRDRDSKERKEDSSSLRSDAQAVACPDARDLLWQQGLPILRGLIGGSDRQTRGLLGRLLRNTHDDCARTLAVVREAADLRPADPQAWLVAASRRRPMQNGFLELIATEGIGARQRAARDPVTAFLEDHGNDWKH